MAGLLQGKGALVTGAASGIGRATSLVLAREGAKVLVVDAVAEGGDETVKMIKNAGGTAQFLKCDVSRAAEVEAMVAAAVTAWGRLDCAFNNAGVGGKTLKIAVDTEENFDRVIAVNLKGVWLCMKYEVLQMRKQGGGAIVNTASVAGLVGSGGMPSYAASKHGVVGLTRTTALDYARHNIRVNAVCPGVIDTAMVAELSSAHPRMHEALLAAEPVKRMGKPSEIGEAVAWLLSDAASFVTGAALPVDGGITAQ